MDELYELEADPRDLTSLFAQPAAQETLASLQRELNALLQQTGGVSDRARGNPSGA